MNDKFVNLLGSGVRNISQAFYDSFVETNAKFRAKAGLKMTIVRESIGECCSWCSDLAGTYSYDHAPDDIYARHRDCNCVVSTRTEKGTWQDAYSRKEYKTFRENRIAREQDIISSMKKKPDFYVGKNGKTLQSKYSEWIGKNRMREYISLAESEDTRLYIKSDYRPTSFIGDGGTAAIRQFEIETGINCGRNGGNHAQKVKDLIRQIEKILLKNPTDNDRIFLEKQLKRLKEVSK